MNSVIKLLISSVVAFLLMGISRLWFLEWLYQLQEKGISWSVSLCKYYGGALPSFGDVPSGSILWTISPSPPVVICGGSGLAFNESLVMWGLAVLLFVIWFLAIWKVLSMIWK
ncbi:hypothetical protein CMO96_04665 [Candidatus Woesebacteria bacterium]|nr:hypothetical protein [Candidatus Woesebacteria bacterium]